MHPSKFSAKDKAIRSQVRMKISNLRSQLKKLQQDTPSNPADIESCKGEIEVLTKRTSIFGRWWSYYIYKSKGNA